MDTRSKPAGRLALTSVLALAVSGCTLGPDFLAPKADAPASWSNAEVGGTDKSVAVATQPSIQWWRSFKDPELASLIERANQSNLDLREAAVRITESRLQERITAASALPTLSGNASYENTRFSDKTAQGSLFNSLGSIKALPGVTIPSLPNPYDQFQVGFDASWEPDLFGGVRRSEEAAHATTEASIETRRDALVSLEAEVARDYIDLRGAQAKLAITNDNLKTHNETLTLTRERQRARLGNDLDVANSAAQVSATQSQLPLLKREIATDINQLSLLLAREPGALNGELETPQTVPPVPPLVPVGLPGDLARRRPDIREAEARLHAATARVGVAVADLYPSIQFDAPAGLQSESLPKLASWQAAFYSIGPTVNIPIFQGGRLRATVKLQEADEKEAAIDYAKTVLNAIHETENALIAYSTEQQHRTDLATALAQNRLALKLAQERYRDGVTSFLDVLDAQRTLLSTELSLADSTAAVSTDLVAIYKALGGGWQDENKPAPKPQ